MLLSVAVLAGFLVWAQGFPVPERARGTGEIVPAGLVQPVQAPEGGRIAAVLAQAGERVTAGQVLVRLDAEAARADAAGARAREAALTLAAARLAAAAEGRLAALSPLDDTALAPIHDSQAAVAEATARLRAAELAVLDAGITAREVAQAGFAEIQAGAEFSNKRGTICLRQGLPRSRDPPGRRRGHHQSAQGVRIPAEREGLLEIARRARWVPFEEGPAGPGQQSRIVRRRRQRPRRRKVASRERGVKPLQVHSPDEPRMGKAHPGVAAVRQRLESADGRQSAGVEDGEAAAGKRGDKARLGAGRQ